MNEAQSAAPEAVVGNDDASKDAYFEKLADLAAEMIKDHGKEFTMGVLILAARFIAEGKSLKGPNSASH